MPEVNLGRVKPIFRGAYSGATTYRPLDSVSHNGSIWFCIAQTTGNAPPNATFWSPVNDVGSNLTQIPSNQLLNDGVNRTAPIGVNTAPFSRYVATGGGGAELYYLLAAINTPGYAAFSGTFTTHRGSSTAAIIGTGNLTVVKRDNSGVRANFDYSAVSSDSTSRVARLVTLDYLGNSYLALAWLAPGSRSPLGFYFTGICNNPTAFFLGEAPVAQVSNVASYTPNAEDYHVGRPGDAIGYRGAIASPTQGAGKRTDWNGGIGTQSGNGVTVSFNIAHGLGGTPTSVSVDPASAAAAEKFWVSNVGSTNIVVTYAVAPAGATDNLAWHFNAWRKIA